MRFWGLRQARWYPVILVGVIIFSISGSLYSFYDAYHRDASAWVIMPKQVDLPIVFDAQGNPVNLQPGENGLMLHWFEPWCANCKAGLSSIATEAALLEKAGIKVVIVSVEDLGNLSVSIPTFRLAASPSGAFATQGVPTSWIFDQHAQMVGRMMGEQIWQRRVTRSIIQSLQDS